MVFSLATRFTLVFSLVLCFWTTESWAQSELPSLAVMPFEAYNVSDIEAQKVSRYVEISMLKTNRFEMVTRQLAAQIEQAREELKTNVDLKVVDQGKAIGADYIVTGTVSGFSKGIQRSKDRKGNPTNQIYTSTQIIYTIKIIEVKTGIIEASDKYSGSLNGIDHHIRNFVRVEFPYDFTILEVLKKKGEKNSKFVLLDGGFLQGLKPGVLLEVFEVSIETFDGRSMRREVKVGDLALRKLDTSGNFSKCVISKGKKTIFKKLEAGIPLICKIPKTFRLFGMKFEYEY